MFSLTSLILVLSITMWVSSVFCLWLLLVDGVAISFLLFFLPCLFQQSFAVCKNLLHVPHFSLPKSLHLFIMWLFFPQCMLGFLRCLLQLLVHYIDWLSLSRPMCFARLGFCWVTKLTLLAMHTWCLRYSSLRILISSVTTWAFLGLSLQHPSTLPSKDLWKCPMREATMRSGQLWGSGWWWGNPCPQTYLCTQNIPSF